jgi:hypothetical protein
LLREGVPVMRIYDHARLGRLVIFYTIDFVYRQTNNNNCCYPTISFFDTYYS